MQQVSNVTAKIFYVNILRGELKKEVETNRVTEARFAAESGPTGVEDAPSGLCQFRTSCSRFSSSTEGRQIACGAPGLALSETKDPGAK
jgi:hypothetical protein